MYRQTPYYPSAPTTTAQWMTATQPTKPKYYSGTEIKGIALLPKQNYAPVTHDDSCTNTDPKKGAGL